MVAAVASYFSKINIILWGGERKDAIFSFPFKTYFFNKDFFENNEKRQGKGSLLLPCSKMPIGIFLFSLKSEFQKSEENGKKRRKPEKISGFSVGIFFVNTSWRRHPDLNRGIEVLQTCALPLGHGAVQFMLYYYSRGFWICQEGFQSFCLFIFIYMKFSYFCEFVCLCS